VTGFSTGALNYGRPICATGGGGGGSASGWSLLGNAGTNPATNFLGTTDNIPLHIRTNNQLIAIFATG
jgi:hypothetical protein